MDETGFDYLLSPEERNCQARIKAVADPLREQLRTAELALRLADRELAVGRRYIPSHGTFGEEGISAYDDAQSMVQKALALFDVALKKEGV